MVAIERVSSLTGRKHTMEIDADPEKLRTWFSGKVFEPIQRFFPELSADAREFLMTGITPQEWQDYVADPDEDDDDTA